VELLTIVFELFELGESFNLKKPSEPLLQTAFYFFIEGADCYKMIFFGGLNFLLFSITIIYFRWLN